MYTMIIADDEHIERKAMNLLMQKEFPEIQVLGLAENGVELVTMVEEHKPDIAIVDVNMPGLNGIDAIDLLCARGVATRFIINTAYSEFDYVQRALALKIDAYILKPEKRETTIGTIRKLCASIDEARSNSQSQRQIKELFGRIQPVMESEIMYSIFIGEPAQENFDAYCEMHAVHFSAGAMVSLVPAAVKRVQLQYQDRHILRQFLNEALGTGCTHMATVHKNSICILLFAPPEQPEEAWEPWLDDVLSVTLDKLCRNCDLVLRAGVGGRYTDFGKMPISYRESLDALRTGGEIRSQQADAYQSAEVAELPDNAYVRMALDYIEKHFAQDVALDTVAEEIGISPFYLSRLIRQEFGQSFVEYLTRVRIDEAVRLAKNTRLTIREIAQRIGYSNPSYFCRVFKRQTGSTIGEIRQRKRRKPD